MRALLVVLALAGCKKSEPTHETPPPPAPAQPALDLPVGLGRPLADAPKPRAVVFVSATGRYEVAPTVDGKRTPFTDPHRAALAVLEAAIAAGAPDADEASLRADELARELAAAKGEEPAPSGTSDTSGTGTAMALDEGKMGKRDAQRAEGQYKMKKQTDDPQLARQQAIEQARAAGILGDGAPQPRTGELRGAHGGQLADLASYAPLVVASPKASAAAVATVLVDVGGMLAVVRDGRTGVLDLGFRARSRRGFEEDLPWVEVFGDAQGLVVLAAPEGTLHPVPWKAGAVDAEALGKVLAQVGKPDEPIDIIAGQSLTTQQLVAATDAIHAAGWEHVGLVDAAADPGQRTAQIKLATGPQVLLGWPNAQGDLEKSMIRKTVGGVRDALLACYTAELATKKLSGTVAVQFMIKQDGKVGETSASGVDLKVSTCVTNVVKGLEFPHPKGGGIVQVNYPFTFRPGR